MTEQTLTERVVSIARDRRAWIPFAVIGVLLLILSTMVIVSLETREEPEPEIDEQLAFDRGEATAQATLRSAVDDAATEAGDAPVTRASEKFDALTTANRAGYLDKHEAEAFEELDERDQADHVFRNYVRLQIYQHASEQFHGATQDIRGTKTRLSLPDIDMDNSGNLTDALERVDLTVGYESEELAAGKLGVSLEDASIRVLQNGELIDRRVTTVNTTVATTLFELHNRTQRYDELLNMGFFEGLGPALEEGSFTGFGQEFGLRLYPVAYAKSFAKYYKPTWFSQIASGRQTEILANHAIYSLQRDAFGISDPHSSTEMRIQTVCLGLNIVEEQLPEPSTVLNTSTKKIDDTVADALGSVMNSSLAQNIGDLTAENVNKSLDSTPDTVTGMICEALKDSYGDEADQDLSDLPTFSDFLGGLQEDDELTQDEVEVSVDTPAALAYREITNGTIDPEDDSLIGGPNATNWKNELRLEPLLTTGSQITNGTDGNGTVDVNESLSGIRENMLSSFYENLDEDDVNAEPGPGDVLEDVYTVEAASAKEFGGSFDDVDWPDGPSGDDWVLKDETADFDVEDVTVDVDDPYKSSIPETEQTFYEVDISVEQDVERSRTWVCDTSKNENFTLCDPGESPYEDTNTGDRNAEVSVTLGGEHSPDVEVERTDDRRVEHLYEEGGETGPDAFDASNFDGVPERILRDAFGAISDQPDGTGSVESTLEEDLWNLDNLGEPLDSDDITQEVAYGSVDGDDGYGDGELSQSDRTDLHKWLKDELTRMVYRNISRIGPPGGYPNGSLLNTSADPSVAPITVDRKEFLNNESADLLSGLREHVADAQKAIVYQDLNYSYPGNEKQGYENLPDMARAELYQRYLNRLNKSIDTTQEIRQTQADDGLVGDLLGGLADVGDEVTSALDGLFGPILDFADEALGSVLADDDDEEAGELDSELFEDVTFEIHGSPTYLEGVDTRSDTAAVRPAGDGSRFAGTDRDAPLLDESGNLTEQPPAGTNYATMYTAYSNPLPYPGLPVIPAIHVVQASLWNVEVGGEYPRFEVSATAGDPSSTTSYVRENRTVEMEIDGERVEVGDVEPINFDSRTALGVLMPPGGGVGDGSPQSWTSASGLMSLFAGCSNTYPARGPHYHKQDGLIRDLLPQHVEDFIDDLENESRKINGEIPILNPIPVDAITTVEDQINCIGSQLYKMLSGVLDSVNGQGTVDSSAQWQGQAQSTP